ncbi:hypothetical protein IKQ19_16010 [Candidatus Saccharibacteria bacterium]|jgi:hypothetical protein|nr:hypothetical protein [Candidatus Saccharibacteria bacterium]
MLKGNIADQTLRNNIMVRYISHNLDEELYGPFIGKNYANKKNDGKRIVVIDAAWWYDMRYSCWRPSNVCWINKRLEEDYQEIVEKGGYQIEKPSTCFKKYLDKVDAFYNNGGRDTYNRKIGLPSDKKDVIGVRSNVEKDMFGVIKNLEKTFKTLKLDLDRESIVFHRFNVRPFEEPKIYEWGFCEDKTEDLKKLRFNVSRVAEKDAKIACDVLDDVLRICKPDMVIFDCYQSMLNVGNMMFLAKKQFLDDYMHELNVSYFGLHNLFVDEPINWSETHLRIKNGKSISVFDELGINLKDMECNGGYPVRKDECGNTLFGVGSNVQTLPSLGDDNDCLDIDMDLIAQLSKTENRIRILAEWLTGWPDGSGDYSDIDKALADLTEDENSQLYQAVMENAWVKLGPPIEALCEGVNVGAFKFESNGVKIEQTEHTEFEEFLIQELQCHGNYEQVVLLKKQENITNNPECRDPEILARSMSCLSKMMLDSIQKQRMVNHKGRIGSFVKRGSEKGVAARTEKARKAVREKGSED